MRPIKALALLPVLLLLSGCFGAAPPVPKEQYFRLVGATPTGMSSLPDGPLRLEIAAYLLH